MRIRMRKVPSMCEKCGDPACIVNHYDMEGNQISLSEWTKLVDSMRDDPGRWEKAKVAYTTFDKPPVNIMTAWMGVTSGEEPPPVWQTNVLIRSIPLPMLLKFSGDAELVDGILEQLKLSSADPGNVLIHLGTPVVLSAESQSYLTKEAALAGHDQVVARIRSIWSDFHNKHNVPEQLRLEDSPGDLEDWDFEVMIPQMDCLPDDPEKK